MSDELMSKLNSVIVDKLGVKEEQITLEASFVDDLGADSLDLVELIMALEDEFNIEIPDGDAEKLLKVSEVVEYVKQKTA